MREHDGEDPGCAFILAGADGRRRRPVPAGQGDAVAANSAGLLDEIEFTNNGEWPVFLMFRPLIAMSPTGTVPRLRLVATPALVGD